MNQPPVMPPAVAPVSPVKKGLPPLAWVGIGCGGLILISIIVMIAAGIWGAKKMTDLGVDFGKNPERAAAELFVNMSPEMKKISSDETAGTITVRMKDGTEKTLSYKDIQEQRFDNEMPAPEIETEPAPTEE